MLPELTFVRRMNRNGVKCIAPFINGWNVWDIPEKEFTPAVQHALKMAYQLGQEHFHASLRDVPIANLRGNTLNTHFKEVK